MDTIESRRTLDAANRAVRGIAFNPQLGRSTWRKDVRRIASMLLAASLATQSVAAPAEQQNGARIVLRVGAGTGARDSNYPNLLAAIVAAEVSWRRDPKAPLRFELSAGETYHLSAPLELPPEIWGTRRSPTVFTSVGGARATISGSHRLSLSWKFYRNGFYVADLAEPALDQLWVNGKRQIRARYPNYDAKA
jgi:hypothetical protein